MVSPTRKFEGSSPKKTKKHYAREEEPEPALEASFDLFDQECTTSQWYSIRIPGALPPRRSFHSSVVINDK